MASDCASVISMMEVDVVCSCRDLASHTSYVGVVQATLLQHLESRLTVKSLQKVQRIMDGIWKMGKWS